MILELENPKYLEYKYYYNVSRKKRGLGVKTISDSKTHNYFLEFFEENLKLSPALLEWSKEYLHELHDKEIETNRAIASQEGSQVEEAEKRKRKILQLMADEQILPEDGRVVLNELNAIISSKDIVAPHKDWFKKALDITDLLEEFTVIMKSDDTRAKREILSRLGSNLIWDEEKLRIVNAKWVDVLIAGLNESRVANEKFEPKKSLANKDETGVFVSVCPILLRDQGSNLGHPP